MISNISNIANRWARAGAMFNATPATESPDLEQLLLDTARECDENSRLFTMAVSWLAQNHRLIDSAKLARLIRSDLEAEFLPTMGLLLDQSHHFLGECCFDAALAACKPAREPHPLFKSEQMNPTIWKLAERRASNVSRRWNLWAPPISLKANAIRPMAHILATNTSYQMA